MGDKEVDDLVFPSRRFSLVEKTIFTHRKQLLNKIYHSEHQLFLGLSKVKSSWRIHPVFCISEKLSLNT